MDDLFEGYMVLDAIGDFLDDHSLTDRTKQPVTTPQSQPGAQTSTGSLTPISGPARNSQGYLCPRWVLVTELSVAMSSTYLTDVARLRKAHENDEGTTRAV